MKKDSVIHSKFIQLQPFLNEKQIRLYAASEAIAFGYGGVTIVSRSTGVSRRAITQGCKELKTTPTKEYGSRIRSKGAGRKKISAVDSKIKKTLEKLIAPATRGDPESPLKWTSKSVRKLAETLNAQKHVISHQTVATLLAEMGYSLQANKKVIEGGNHPDRNAQFEHINNKVKTYQQMNQPVISVDTKKKELVGNFSNNGRELQPKKTPELVNVYDFPDKELGKVSP